MGGKVADSTRRVQPTEIGAVRVVVQGRIRDRDVAAATRLRRGWSRHARAHQSLVLTALVALGAVVRLYALGASRLSYDESFTAMAARLPLGSLLDYLRVNDSHPPLDYVLRAPLARQGVDEFWLRAPSVVMATGALALLAWWLRRRGRVAVIATALFALNAFLVVHGRDARMYAEMELIGVAAAVLADAWLARARLWHASAIGALVLVGLLTHTSMALLGIGLVCLPGRRTDGAAWCWRAALAVGFVAWLLLWGPSFLLQAQGGHSSWIGATTPWGLVAAIGHLATGVAPLYVVAVAATIVGARRLRARDGRLHRVWMACFAVPVLTGAVVGVVAPVVLDRTFTVVAWAPVVAIAWFLDDLADRRPRLGVVALAATLAISAGATAVAIGGRSLQDAPLRQLARVTRPGDVVAIHPASRAPELAWAVLVRGKAATRPVALPGARRIPAWVIGPGPMTGRVWLLDWASRTSPTVQGARRCAPPWFRNRTAISCLRVAPETVSPMSEANMGSDPAAAWTSRSPDAGAALSPTRRGGPPGGSRGTRVQGCRRR